MLETRVDRQSNKDLEHNYRVAVFEGASYSLMYGLTGSFLGVLALKMGASPFQLSLMTALPNLINVLLMVPVASYLEKRSRKMPYLVGGVFFNRIGFFFIALVAFLDLSPNTFLLVQTLMTIPAVVAGLAYTDVVASCFAPRERGKVFGTKNAVVGFLTFICTIIGGFFLDTLSYPYNYLWVFSVASVFGIINTYLMSRLRIAKAPIADKKAEKEPYLGRLRKIFSHPQLGPEFRRFLLTIFLIHVGFNIPSAIWTLFYVNEMQMTQLQIGYLAAISNIIIVIFSLFWGRKVQKSGDKIIYVISLGGITLVAIWAAFAGSVFSLYLMQILNGFVMAAYNLAYFNILLSSSEEKYRPTATATFYVLIGLTGVLFPAIGIWLYEILSMRQIFILSALVRFVAFGIAFWDIRRTGLKDSQHKKEELFC